MVFVSSNANRENGAGEYKILYGRDVHELFSPLHSGSLISKADDRGGMVNDNLLLSDRTVDPRRSVNVASGATFQSLGMSMFKSLATVARLRMTIAGDEVSVPRAYT